MVTLRPEPGDHPEQQRDTLAALSRQPATERIDLAPFTAAEVATYLCARSIAEPPGLVGTLLERTGGNPFYLGEILRLPDRERRRPDAVPPGVRDVIGRRVARLPEETQELLRAAAVAGREVDADLLEAVIGQPVEYILEALEPTVATGLLTESPAGADYRFAHALVRDAVHAELTRLERARLHLRVGEALEPRAAEPATLAHYFAAATRVGGAAKAVEYASRAARQATGQTRLHRGGGVLGAGAGLPPARR